MWLLDRIGCEALGPEDQAEYSSQFERRMKQSKYWLTLCFFIAFILYLLIITPLLVSADTHVCMVIGIIITCVGFLLCGIVIIELLDKPFLFRLTQFRFSHLEMSNMVVLLGALGGCFEFIGRIENGGCEEGQNLFTCNPLHEEGHFPSDVLLLIGSFIIFSQIVGCMNDCFILILCWVPVVCSLFFVTYKYMISDAATPVMALFFM